MINYASSMPTMPTEHTGSETSPSGRVHLTNCPNLASIDLGTSDLSNTGGLLAGGGVVVF